MKNNFFKYIFILFIVGIIIFAIYMIYFKEEQQENKIEETRRRGSYRSKRVEDCHF